jgi:hypothetical protein
MHLKPLRHLLSLAFFVFAALNASAQQPDNQYFIPLDMPKSPNSTQFAKYGDYPVNLYSGLPEISIPLYTVESGGLSVPVTLSYHASGLADAIGRRAFYHASDVQYGYKQSL